MRTIDWDGSDVLIIDQTLLPHEERILHLHTVAELAEAIRSLRVRGAMALGVAGGLGVALAIKRANETGCDPAEAAEVAAAELTATRPTAVNLRWGTDQVLKALPRGADVAVATAAGLIEADIVANRALAQRGAALLDELLGPGPLTVLTHCNAGALAAVDWGSALGIIRAMVEAGTTVEVWACETRPLLQGIRLTAWELKRMGVPYRVIVDGAAAGLIATGRVDAVITGADRIAANGDVANKVGTYAHALAAGRARVPFIVAAPETTIDPATPDGASIPIEDRPGDEVLSFGGVGHAPEGSLAFNPAFDVTPADLVTAIVTDRRVIKPALGERPVVP